MGLDRVELPTSRLSHVRSVVRLVQEEMRGGSCSRVFEIPVAADKDVVGNTVSVHHPHDPEWFQLLAYFISGLAYDVSDDCCQMERAGDDSAVTAALRAP